MNYRIVDNSVILSLDKNDFINQSIKQIFEKEKLLFGWISGIGAIHNIQLGYYDLENKDYIRKSFLDEHELLSLSGNVTLLDSQYFVHTHAVISDQNFRSFGGHLFDAQIAAAGEFKISLFDCAINRKLSNDIGLNLWCMENNENN